MPRLARTSAVLYTHGINLYRGGFKCEGNFPRGAQKRRAWNNVFGGAASNGKTPSLQAALPRAREITRLLVTRSSHGKNYINESREYRVCGSYEHRSASASFIFRYIDLLFSFLLPISIIYLIRRGDKRDKMSRTIKELRVSWMRQWSRLVIANNRTGICHGRDSFALSSTILATRER